MLHRLANSEQTLRLISTSLRILNLSHNVSARRKQHIILRISLATRVKADLVAILHFVDDHASDGDLPSEVEQLLSDVLLLAADAEVLRVVMQCFAVDTE